MRDKYYELSPEAVKIQRSLGDYLAAGPLGKALAKQARLFKTIT